MATWMRSVFPFLSLNVLCAASSLAHLPLSFEPGVHSSEFVGRTGGLSLVLTPTMATLGRGSMRLIGGRMRAPAQPEDLLPGYSNYLVDPDPRKWRKHVPHYRRVRYQNVYPGIDVVFYGNPRDLEFDFIVAPGADPRRIRLALSSQDLRIRLPRVFQDDRAIEGRAIRRGNRVAFELAAYDRSRPLVIDPVLSYASVFGGAGSDEGRAIAVDASGAVYVVGNAFDQNFPVVNGQSNRFSFLFLAKVNPAGDALVYSTYLSSAAGAGPGNIAIDSSGSVYVAGSFFNSPNGSSVPAVGPPPLGTCTAGGQPVLYVAKLSPDGASLVYSGCISGLSSPGANAIAVDGKGNSYVAGSTQSTDFPLVNPLPSSSPPSGPPKGFVLEFGPDGALLYSTFFGGGNFDSIRAIAADPAGNIYLAGQANSPDFPLKNAIQSRPPGSALTQPSFIAKINADRSDFVYSTYLSGSGFDSALAIAADTLGNTYVAGSTTSGDFPTTSNALQRQFNGVFAFKSVDGAANWSRSDSGLLGAASFVQVDPNNPATVYAVSAGGIFKSTDRGATWRATSAGAVSSLWIDPADSSLYLETNHSDFVRSRDGGATFTTINTGIGGNLNQMVFDPKNAQVIYGRWGGTGSGDGVYKSTDGGDSWKPTGLTGSGTGSGGLAIDPAHPSTVYATSRNKGLMQSANGGDTWTTLDATLFPNQLTVDSASRLYAVSNGTVIVRSGDAVVTKTAPALVSTLFIDPTNSSTWYVTTYSPSNSLSESGIYKTADAGNTWQRIDKGLPHSPAVTSLAIDPKSPGTLYLGMGASSDGFFAKLNSDGSSLLYSTYLGGGSADSVNAVAADASGNAYLAGTTNSTDFPTRSAFRDAGSGFAAKFDSGNALVWSSLLGDATPRAIALGPGGEVYLTGSSASDKFATPGPLGRFISGDVFRTSDGGASWTGITLKASSYPTVGALAVDPQTPSRVFALADHLYGSTDGGQNWTQLANPWGSSYPVPLPFFSPALVLDPLTPTTMYQAGSLCAVVNGVSTGCGVAKSTDGGVTWTTYPIVVADPNQPPASILGLAIDPKTPSTLYAAVGNGGIYKSTDAGATWNHAGSLTLAGAVAVDPTNPAVVYASIGSGLPPSLIPPGAFNGTAPLLSKSSDAGATWTTIINGLPSGWFAGRLVVDPAVPGRVYATGSFIVSGCPLPSGAGNTCNLYRSDNGGSSWMAIVAGLPDSPLNSLAIDPSNSSTLYAAPSAGGLYRSVDAGANWALMPGLRVPIVTAIAVDPSDSSRLYTGTQTNPGDAFVMKIDQ